MLASRLSQFGLMSARTLNVDVGICEKEVCFGVRFYECAAAGDRKLMHAELFNPDHPDRDEMFWVRVMIYFQLAAELDQARGHSVTGIGPELLRRTQLLGHVGVAYPQRNSALERRTISVRNAQAARADEVGASPLEAAAGNPDGMADVRDLDLERFAMATLMGVCELSEAEIREYLEFEKTVRDQMSKLLAKHSGPGEWRTAYKEMKDYLVRIRKNADENKRKLLLLLQSACDIQLMHMYQFVAGAVLKTTAVSAVLGPVSLVYNRTVHAVQDRLGGIVPAVHPLWPVCLKTQRIVGVLFDYAGDPKPVKHVNSVNACLCEALRGYVRILEPVFADEKFVSLEAPVGDGTRTTGDFIGERDRGLSEAELSIDELIDRIREECGSDRDVAVAYDTVYGGLEVKTAAEKYACSNGEISKRKKRGLAKMRAILQRMGLGFADVLGAFCKCQPSTAECFATHADRSEKGDDGAKAATVSPAAFSWDKKRTLRKRADRGR